MTPAGQRDAVAALQEWSGWAIGLGFAAGTGCVVILRGAAAGLPRTLLIGAIAAFVLSVLVALGLRLALARIVERVPLCGADGAPVSVMQARAYGPVTVGAMARAQLLVLLLGGLCLLGWVVLLPA